LPRSGFVQQSNQTVGIAIMKWRNLKDVVPELKKRPGMFIGSNSIFDLATFLQGYDFALSVHGITKESLFDEDISFHDWIALRTHYYESTSGWANMLTETYGENRALEQFWGHYDEYLNRKYTTMPIIFGGLLFTGTSAVTCGLMFIFAVLFWHYVAEKNRQNIIANILICRLR